MKKVKIIFLFLIFIIINNIVYAKYTYNFDDTVIELTRDSTPITARISYSTEEWTNENVIITIKTNKEVEQISGFVLSEDKKTLTKEVSANESATIELRDLSGNSTEIEYTVNNIDKELPQIIGCEDGGIYSAPLSLSYTDNNELSSVIVNKYDDNLYIRSDTMYRDNAKFFGIDRTDTTLTVHITKIPLNTVKYKYYLNGIFYATTANKEYTYTGLQKGTNYTIKVEAIDNNGEIIDSFQTGRSTSYFSNITSQKTLEMFNGNLNNLDSNVVSAKYVIWNDEHFDEGKWYDIGINNNTINLNIAPIAKYNTFEYTIHVYLYDKNNNVLDVVGFSVDFKNSYTPVSSTINPELLTEIGNYQIMVEDVAGNKLTYYIKLQ